MVFKNPAMKKILPKGGRRIILYTDDDLKKWISEIPKAKHPRMATLDECYSLLVLLFYTGARPSELVLLKKDDIYPLIELKGLALTLTTLKGGNNPRKISIPLNEITLKAYKLIENSSPVGYYFHAFHCKGNTGKQTRTTHRNQVIYVREQNGTLLPETKTTTTQKDYFMNNKKVYQFITSLTGLPPLYFRHHRLSWMAKMGATTFQMREFKGSKDDRSVTPYLQLGANAEKEFLTFFPKGDSQ